MSDRYNDPKNRSWFARLFALAKRLAADLEELKGVIEREKELDRTQLDGTDPARIR